MSDKLKKDIEDTWGPYSQQAMAYKSILKRLEVRPAHQEPVEARPSIEPAHVAKLTATYFLTRGVIIVTAWMIFLTLFLGIAAGTLWYVSSEIESSSQIIRSR